MQRWSLLWAVLVSNLVVVSNTQPLPSLTRSKGYGLVVANPAISPFTPSSIACPVGVQFLPRKRGGSTVLSSTTTYCGLLFLSLLEVFCEVPVVVFAPDLPE